jgi:hypothetical protein
MELTSHCAPELTLPRGEGQLAAQPTACSGGRFRRVRTLRDRRRRIGGGLLPSSKIRARRARVRRLHQFERGRPDQLWRAIPRRRANLVLVGRIHGERGDQRRRCDRSETQRSLPWGSLSKSLILGGKNPMKSMACLKDPGARGRSRSKPVRSGLRICTDCSNFPNATRTIGLC